MATMKTQTVRIPLLNHGLESMTGGICHEPEVIGNFAADTVIGKDGKEYALFTVIDPDNGMYPSEWAGTYRISVSRIKSCFRCIPDGPNDPVVYRQGIFESV